MTYSSLKYFVRPAVLGTALLAAFALPAIDQPKDADSSTSSSQSSSDAVKFIKQAGQHNSAEAAMAEVGLKKAQNEKLRDFCKQLQKDHMLAGEQLRPIALKYGVPAEQSVDEKAQKHLEKLQKAEASSFDKEFATEILKAHQKDIKQFSKAAQELQESDVKQFAQDQLPKLQQHFQTASQVAQTVGVDEATVTSLNKDLPQAVGGTSESQSTTQGSGSSSKSSDD